MTASKAAAIKAAVIKDLPIMVVLVFMFCPRWLVVAVSTHVRLEGIYADFAQTGVSAVTSGGPDKSGSTSFKYAR